MKMKRMMVATAIAMLAMLCVPTGAARIMGDADGNGTVNIVDALQIARHDAGLIVLEDLEVADVDGNGTVNIVDALQVARYDAGLISEFPAQIDDVPPPSPDNDDDDIPDDEHYTLTVTCEPVGGGTVTGAGEYPIVLPSELASMRATPTPNWRSTHWSGDADGTSKNGFVVMDGNKTVTANFEEAGEPNPDDPETDYWFDLTVSADPSSQGTVAVGIEPQPEGYISGTRVRVTGVPNTADYTFSHWTGDVGDTQAASTIVVMDEDQSVTAHFAVAPPSANTLTTAVYPDMFAGSVFPASGEFEDGPLTLYANSADGYMFDYWIVYEGIRYENPLTLTISSDATVSAYFTPIPAPPATSYIQMFGIIASLVGGVGLVVTVSKWGW